MPIFSTMPAAQRLWTPHSGIPIFDAVGAGAISTSTPSSISWSHTFGQRVFSQYGFVFICTASNPYEISGTGSAGTAATVNARNIGNNSVATGSTSGGQNIQINFQNIIPSGAQTVTANFATAPVNAIGCSISFFNGSCNNTNVTPTNNSNTGSSTTLTSPALTTFPGTIVIGLMTANINGAITVTSGTSRYSNFGGSTDGISMVMATAVVPQTGVLAAGAVAGTVTSSSPWAVTILTVPPNRSN